MTARGWCEEVIGPLHLITSSARRASVGRCGSAPDAPADWVVLCRFYRACKWLMSLATADTQGRAHGRGQKPDMIWFSNDTRRLSSYARDGVRNDQGVFLQAESPRCTAAASRPAWGTAGGGNASGRSSRSQWRANLGAAVWNFEILTSVCLQPSA